MGGPIIGYKYYLGEHDVLCQGPVDSINEIQIDDKRVWSGEAADTSIYISKPELFGEFEGGIEGSVDIQVGKSSQGENSYLKRVLKKIGGSSGLFGTASGGFIPSFRGVVSIVKRKMYIGNSANLRPWAYLVQRVLTKTDETPQWQPDLAPIKETGASGYDEINETYLQAIYTPEGGEPMRGFVLNDQTRDRMYFIDVPNGDESYFSEVPWGNINRFIGSEQRWTGRLDFGYLLTKDVPANTVQQMLPAGCIGHDGGIILAAQMQSPNNSVRILRLDPTTLRETHRSDQSMYLTGAVDYSGDILTISRMNWLGETYCVGGAVSANGGRDRIDFFRPSFRSTDPDDPLGLNPDNIEYFLEYAHTVDNNFYPQATRVKLVRLSRGELLAVYYVPTTTTEWPTNRLGFVVFRSDYDPDYGYLLPPTAYDAGTLDLPSPTSHGFSIAPASDGILAITRNSISKINVTLVDFKYNPDIYTQDLVWSAGHPGFTDGFVATPTELGRFLQYTTSLRTLRFTMVEGSGVFRAELSMADGALTKQTALPGKSADSGIYFQQNFINDFSFKFELPKLTFTSATVKVIKNEVLPKSRGADMNPAHIIREVLTNKDWGRGLPEELLDEESFIDAAEVLYGERMGLSFFWSKETPVNEFLQTVLSHIDAVLRVDHETGKFSLKLIRDDYGSIETLPVYSDANVVSWEEVNYPLYDDLINTVAVQFTDREERSTGSVTAQNLALIQVQGREVSTNRVYPGITNRALANRVAARDLRSLSTPLINGSIKVKSDDFNLHIGDVFVLLPDRHGLESTVCRVTELDFGDHKKGAVRIRFVQDTFGVTFSGLVSDDAEPSPSLLVDPVKSPREIGVEAPYWSLVNELEAGAAEAALAADNDVGYVYAGGARPSASEAFAKVETEVLAEVTSFGNVSLSPYFELQQALTDHPSSVFLSYDTGRNMGYVEKGHLGLVGDEFVVVEDIFEDGILLSRAVLDSVPMPHAVGDKVVFLTNSGDVLDKQFTAGEEVNVYVAPRNTSGVLPIRLVDVQTINFNSRAFRPMPPANQKLNGAYVSVDPAANPVLVDSATITWAHRNRLTQITNDFLPWALGSVTPEDGVSYHLKVEGVRPSGVVSSIATLDLGSGRTAEISLPFIPAYTYQYIKLSLYSTRDGYSNYFTKSGIYEFLPSKRSYASRLVFGDNDLVGESRSYAKTLMLSEEI